MSNNFKLMGYHRTDTSLKISAYRYLQTNITYNFNRYDFLDWKFTC